jgi:hypothetical protein
MKTAAPTTRDAVSRRARERIQRWAITLTVAAVAARIAFAQAPARPRPSDFGQTWAAAQFLLRGVNPYEAVGPAGEFWFHFPLFYPLTAVVASIPFSWLPAAWADGAFMALGCGLLAWALTRTSPQNPQLLVFVSCAFLTAVGNVQWSPLLTASVLLPPLGFLLASKPTIAAALLVAYPSWRALMGALVFGLLTILVWPWWVQGWLESVRQGSHFVAPVTVWGGPLVLLALLKWRRPEARLLAAFACIPHTPVLYETVPLFLVVRRWWEGAALALLTPVVWYLQDRHGLPYPSYEAWTLARAQWQVWLIYVPCVAMVLARPNVSDGSFEALAASLREALKRVMVRLQPTGQASTAPSGHPVRRRARGPSSRRSSGPSTR